MPVIKVGRINISYQRKGNGHPVIFISGLSADKEHWDPVADQLKDKYDCITFDKRGNGESSAPRHGYTTADLTGDTVGLLDKLGISRAHVVGISLGGKVAMSVAFHYPERVVGLVLLGVFAGDRDARTRHWMNMRKLLQRRLNRYEYSMLAAFQFFGREAHSRPGFVEDWAKKEAEKPHPQKSYAFDQLLEEGGDFNVAEHLKDIRQPTLVMVGEDEMAAAAAGSRLVAEGIAGAELQVLPGLGHFCNIENPEEVADRIDSFLKRVDAR